MVKRFFLIFIYAISIGAVLNAAEPTVNVAANGTTTNFAISELRKLYFSGDDMIVVKTTGEETTFAMDDISEITMSGLDSETGLFPADDNCGTKTLYKRLENGKVVIEKDNLIWNINGMLLKSNNK